MAETDLSDLPPPTGRPAPGDAPVVPGAEEARILDRGYRRYEGSRRGVPGAMRSVAVQSFRSVLGLGRAARHKILPVVVMVVAYLPAIVFVGLAVLIPGDLEEDLLPTYPDYFGQITLAILLFTALVAPEVLVGDRRNGLLGLYLSTPLDRRTYLGSKGIAVLATLALVTVGPALLLLLALSFEGSGPDGLAEWLKTFGRIIGGGLIVAAPYTAVSLAAASLTDRRAFASVGIILLMIVSTALVNVLIETADWSENLRVFDLFGLPFEMVQRVFAEPGQFPEVSTALLSGATAGWTLLGLGVVWWRYRQLVVSK